MNLPYATSTAGDRALTELQRTLEKFDCQAFGTMIDRERGVTIVQFKWRGKHVQLEASWQGYAGALLKNKKKRYGDVQKRLEQAALEQAKISVCSVLRDWVKGQVTAIECGVMSFEAAFMPHMLTAQGIRVIDHVRSQKLLGNDTEQEKQP